MNAEGLGLAVRIYIGSRPGFVQYHGRGGTLNRKLAHKRLIVSSLVQVQLQGGLGFQFGVQLGAPVPILASLLFGLPDRTELGQVAPSHNRCSCHNSSVLEHPLELLILCSLPFEGMSHFLRWRGFRVRAF